MYSEHMGNELFHSLVTGSHIRICVSAVSLCWCCGRALLYDLGLRVSCEFSVDDSSSADSTAVGDNESITWLSTEGLSFSPHKFLYRSAQMFSWNDNWVLTATMPTCSNLTQHTPTSPILFIRREWLRPTCESMNLSSFFWRKEDWGIYEPIWKIEKHTQ